MWEIDNKIQAVSLLQSVLLGVFFCIFYDFFKAYRLAAKPKRNVVFIQDIVYFIICAPLTFCFLLSVTNGEIRGYVFISAVLGFALTRLTLSRTIVKVLTAFFILLLKISKASNRLIDKISKLILKLFKRISLLYLKICKNIRKCFKKVLKKQ